MDTPSVSRRSKVLASLCYAGFFLILALAAWDDDFLRYHAKQAAVLVIFFIAIEFTVRLVVGERLWLIGLANYVWAFAFDIYGIINCGRGRKAPLPLIGKIAEKVSL